MKKTLSIFLILFSLTLTAQEYIPMLQDGNKWGTVFCSFGECSGIGITQIIGEEVINGKTYKILNNESCLMREEDGIVYVLNDDMSEDIFLDFTLDVGDSFFPQDIRDNCLNEDFSTTDEFRITDVQTQFILGVDRKVLYMDYYEDGIQTDLDGEEEIWVEGIGSTAAIGPGGFAFDNDVILVCFTNNTGTISINGNTISDSNNPCEATAGVSEFVKEQIYFLPMPITETAALNIPQEISKANLKVFDLNGKLVVDFDISEKTSLLDFHKLISGIYFYQIYSNNELLVTKKLIVN